MLITYRLEDEKIDYRTKRNGSFWPLFLSSSTSEKLSLQWPWSELELRCLLLASGFPQFSVATSTPRQLQTLREHWDVGAFAWLANNGRNDFQDVDRRNLITLIQSTWECCHYLLYEGPLATLGCLNQWVPGVSSLSPPLVTGKSWVMDTIRQIA